MEFCDVVKEYCRMCDSISIKGGCPLDCDIEGFNRGQCDRYLLREPEKAEKIVKKWSEEHPLSVEEALEQLRWYFKEDDGLAAEKKTRDAFDIVENRLLNLLNSEKSCLSCKYYDSHHMYCMKANHIHSNFREKCDDYKE